MALSVAEATQPSTIYSTIPRLLSLVGASALFAMVLLDPRPLAAASHGMLTLMMLGMSAGFVHGVGFVPQSRLWKIVFGPWFAWIMIVTGFSLFFN